MIKHIIVAFALVLIPLIGNTQSNFDAFSNKLEELSKTKKGLNDDVRIDLSGLTLYDFITTLAEEHELNVSVDPKLTDIVTSNFYDINVKDIFIFLIEKYQLDVDVMNNILIFNKKAEEIIVEKPLPPKPIDVSYNSNNDFLSVKLQNDSLPRVARAITDASGKNIVLSPDVKNQAVSAYILNRPFDQVMDMMAKSNNLSVNKDESNNYFLEKAIAQVEEPQQNQRNNSSRRNTGKNTNTSSGLEIELNEQGFLNIRAFEADANDLILEAAQKLNINFFMYNTPEGISTTLIAKGITFDDLLNHLFKGEKYTYKIVDGLYLIGEHTTEGLRTTELIRLENRSIETVLATIPKSITQSLEIKEFPELNGFVVSGSKNQIQEFKDFVREIDVVVPVIQIEVIIVQYQKSYDIQTGIKAGIDDQKRTTSGVLFPTQDVVMNSSTINKLIDAFNGLGVINLGKVTENFYLNLMALENNSLIKVTSTPKLVTLNGHEATSAIGETSYYFEQRNELINTGVNNNVLQSGTWKSTEANMSITIEPAVSQDENVTLTITVEKSSFLGRAGENAPPGKATQKFQSMIRVKNNEMILLGGLDELDSQNAGTGTPGLSRVWGLKWLFSSRKKSKEKSKLHIFIKPTILY